MTGASLELLLRLLEISVSRDLERDLEGDPSLLSRRCSLVVRLPRGCEEEVNTLVIKLKKNFKVFQWGQGLDKRI